MSQVTDQASSQNLIELAKKQYEKQQRSKVPGHIVKLPSLGWAYPESSPLRAGTVEIRYMTAYDEDILSNQSYISQNNIYEKLIDSIMLTDGVQAKHIATSDIEAIIIMARIHSYGDKYPVLVTHPETKQQLKRDINLSEIEFKPFKLESDENGEFEYVRPDNGDVLKFKYLNIEESNTIDDGYLFSELTTKSICAINGNRDKNFISDYVKYQFIGKESRSFRKYLSDNMPGLNLNIIFQGDNGDTFESRFQIGSDIFWV